MGKKLKEFRERGTWKTTQSDPRSGLSDDARSQEFERKKAKKAILDSIERKNPSASRQRLPFPPLFARLSTILIIYLHLHIKFKGLYTYMIRTKSNFAFFAYLSVLNCILHHCPSPWQNYGPWMGFLNFLSSPEPIWAVVAPGLQKGSRKWLFHF